MKLYPAVLILLLLCSCSGTPKETAPVVTIDSSSVKKEDNKKPQGDTTDIPKKDASWADQKLNAVMPGLVISTPKNVKVIVYDSQVSVKIDDKNYMTINKETIDVAKEMDDYLHNDSREDMNVLIGTKNEFLYTCTDLSAPKGFRNSNSFIACKEIGGKPFSVWADGITINDAKTNDIDVMSAENCKLLFAIFRTLRIEKK